MGRNLILEALEGARGSDSDLEERSLPVEFFQQNKRDREIRNHPGLYSETEKLLPWLARMVLCCLDRTARLLLSLFD